MDDERTTKVTILGSGTSTGVPMPGCECAVCLSDDPRNKRLRPSALITRGERNILIDAGPDFRQQALRARIPSIDAILFTHAHADHILGIDDLRCYNFKQSSSIPCFGTQPTLDQIRRIFFYVFDRDPNYLGGGISQLRLEPIVHEQQFEVHGMSILPFPLEHGRLTVTGFRVGRFAYATDCHAIPASAREALRGVETLVLDGLRDNPHQTHMTIDQAISNAEQLGVKKLYLIHMSHSVDHATTAARLPDWVELSYDGMTFSVPD